jgi:hypothetical protein
LSEAINSESKKIPLTDEKLMDLLNEKGTILLGEQLQNTANN